MRPWIALTSLLLAPMAQAQECDKSYSIDDLLTDLALTEAALRNADNVGAGEAAARLQAGLPCSDDLLPGVMVPRVYRALGAGIFVGGDPDSGLNWLRTAAELEPEFDYSAADVPADHPARSGLKLAKVEIMGTEPTPVANADDFGIGKHFLDGRAIETPSATLERNHVYQRLLDETYTFVIAGNEFPDQAFGAVKQAEPQEVPDDEPKTNQPQIPEAQVVTQVKWPAERVVLVAAGGASLVASGALYGLSAMSRGNFNDANSVPDIDKYQRSTNTFVVASGATGAAGVGMLGFGALFFVIDGDPRPTLDFRF